MSGLPSLCNVTPVGDAAGCCAAAKPTGPAVPASVSNPPGLPAISYRIGTFTSFRRAMLEQVAEPDLLLSGAASVLVAAIDANATAIKIDDATGFPTAAPFRIRIGAEYLLVISGAGAQIWDVTRGVDGSTATGHAANDAILLDPVNPFANWREGTASDYQTVFIELWAYLADILTFYQERIANEAFLGTATQRDSLLRLAALVDSTPSPGAGAAGQVSFTVAKGPPVAVPAGFRVGSRASAGKPAAVFETSTAITALSDHNKIPVFAVSLVDQFATSSTSTVRQIVLAGANRGLRIGDYIVAVCNERFGSAEVARAFRLRSVRSDRATNTTTITWTETAGTVYDQSLAPVSLYALNVSAGPFGNNAPAHDTLPPALTVGLSSPPTKPVYPDDWDDPSKDAAYVGFSGGGTPVNAIDLDGVYDSIRASPEIPSWAVVLGNNPPMVIETPDKGTGTGLLYHVSSANPVSRTGYTLNAKVTRLVFPASERVPNHTFSIRATVILAGTTLLPVQPLRQPVSGSSLALGGIFDQLRAGQAVIVQGPVAGTQGATIAVESRVLDGPPLPDAAGGVTTIKLTSPLQNQYDAVGTVVMANVAAITQGETVHDEVLGNGTGAAFQSFVLKKSPLTFLPTTDAAGVTAVADTLIVTVNGVRWAEAPNLIDSGANAQTFFARTNDQQQTTVSFGDGYNGAPPPTGVGNIHARYRRGLGASGNLPGGAIQQLLDSAPGLQGVTNPHPSGGGADPADSAQIRQTTPFSVSTFGRAVSAPDYAALALQFPSISKATASWVARGPDGKPVYRPYMQLTVATNDGAPIAGSVTAENLRKFIDNHRDTNVPLRILDFTPVYIDVSLTVDILDQYPRQATLARVTAALNPAVNPDGSAGYFSFARTAPGASVHLSTVYAAAQSIAGVTDVVVTRLRPTAADPAHPEAVWNDIFVRPTELVVVGNDPNDPSKGTLTITYGSGGFADA